MRVHLTDGLIVEGDGSSFDEGALPRQARVVLAYLVVERDRPVPRDEIAEVLWPTGLPQRWEKALAAIVSRLRSGLSGVGLDRASSITSGFGCYQLHLPRETWVDVAAAAVDVARAEGALAAGDLTGALAAAKAASAIGRRHFLPGEEGPWVDRMRADLRGLLIRSLDCRVDACISVGDASGAVAAAVESVELEPLREVAHQRLMRASVAAGDHAEALRAYERCRRLLAEELGVDPSPATQALHVEILRASGDPRPALADHTAVADRIRAPSVRSNRAFVRTSFVGRRIETQEVLALIGDARLVTITGIGGSGKTRLALHVGQELIATQRRDVSIVDLASAGDPIDVVRLLASTLGVLDPLVEAHQSVHPGAIEEEVIRFLLDAPMLVMLDNCEHLVEACRTLCDLLLDRCPSLRMLVTSHGPLGVADERLYPLPPLAGPSLDAVDRDAVATSDAVRLFVDRARSVRPWFELSPQNAVAVAEICRRLEGLPLAIELAASKIGVLSPSQIAERLDDAFRLLIGGPAAPIERHQTLLATMDWTHGLLRDDERAMLRRLAVFADGCTLEAAEHVCAGDPVRESDALAALERLVSKSLVIVDTSGPKPRYRLLEPVRQFAHARLLEAGEEQVVRERHRDWYLSRAAGIDNLATLDPDRAEALHAERMNISAAFRWSIDNGHGKLALKIATSATAWWRPMGLIAASAAMLDEALRAADPAPSRLRAAALGLAAWCDSETGNLVRSVDRFREALDVALVIGGSMIPWTQLGLGHALFFRGDTAGAVEALEDSLRRHRASDDRIGEGWSLQHLVVISFAIGDLVAAKDHAAAMVRLDVELPAELDGMRSVLLGHVMALEGNVERGRELMRSGAERVRESPYALTWADEYAAAMEIVIGGRLADAEHLLRRAIVFQRDYGFVKPLAESLQLCATIAANRGEAERAAQLFGASDTLRAETGLRREPVPWTSVIAGHRTAVLNEVGDAGFAAGRALSRSAAAALAVESLGVERV